MTTCCLPYECGVWHPAAQVPAALTPLGWGLPPSSGVKAALGVARYPLFSSLKMELPQLRLGAWRQQDELGTDQRCLGSGCSAFPTPADSAQGHPAKSP